MGQRLLELRGTAVAAAAHSWTYFPLQLLAESEHKPESRTTPISTEEAIWIPRVCCPETLGYGEPLWTALDLSVDFCQA